MIGSHLNIEIRVTPFDFMTGKLIDHSTKSNWIGNDNTEFSNPPRFVNYYIFYFIIIYLLLFILYL